MGLLSKLIDPEATSEQGALESFITRGQRDKAKEQQQEMVKGVATGEIDQNRALDYVASSRDPKKTADLLKAAIEIKNTESPQDKRSGDLYAKGFEKGIIPLDEQGNPLITPKTQGAGNTLAKAFQMENQRVLRQDTLKQASELRKEFYSQKPVEDFMKLRDQYTTMKMAMNEAKTNPQSMVAIDQTLVTIFNKILDPTSVVRESEYARTGQNMSFINNLRGKAEQIMQGGAGLTQVERKALTKIASQVMASRQDVYQGMRNDYTQLAQDYGVPKAEMVVGRDYQVDTNMSDFMDDEEYVVDENNIKYLPVKDDKGNVIGFQKAKK